MEPLSIVATDIRVIGFNSHHPQITSSFPSFKGTLYWVNEFTETKRRGEVGKHWFCCLESWGSTGILQLVTEWLQTPVYALYATRVNLTAAYHESFPKTPAFTAMITFPTSVWKLLSQGTCSHLKNSWDVTVRISSLVSWPNHLHLFP